jgi:hypothetical protein
MYKLREYVDLIMILHYSTTAFCQHYSSLLFCLQDTDGDQYPLASIYRLLSS